MEVSDIHVGKQLHCNFSPQGLVPIPPLCFGFGPTTIPGTGFFNGAVLVGNPLNFPIPNIPEATLMVGRASPINNPLAAVAPSIFKVTSRASAIPIGTPIDVMLGDPTGPVGVSCFCGIQPFVVQSASIDFISLKYDLISPIRMEVGSSSDIGAKVFGGSKAELGVDVNMAAAFNMAPITDIAPIIAPDLVSATTTLNATFAVATSALSLAGKGFDIPHPTKQEHRLRYICLEGPEVGAYLRGTLKGIDVIELPEYWKDLVYLESITVNITPVGSYQELYVESFVEIGNKIRIKSKSKFPIHCHYTIFGERKTHDKLQVEYKGLTPDDYPGDNREYALGGWDYARHKGEIKSSNL